MYESFDVYTHDGYLLSPWPVITPVSRVRIAGKLSRLSALWGTPPLSKWIVSVRGCWSRVSLQLLMGQLQKQEQTDAAGLFCFPLCVKRFSS